MVEPDEFQFTLGERVRLVDDFQGLPKGMEGVVRGFYRDNPQGYAVDFTGPFRRVPPDYLEPADPELS